MPALTSRLVDPDLLAASLVRLCQEPEQRSALQSLYAALDSSNTLDEGAVLAHLPELRLLEDAGLIVLQALGPHSHRLTVAVEVALSLEIIDLARATGSSSTEGQILASDEVFAAARRRLFGGLPIPRTANRCFGPLDLMILGLMIRRVTRASLSLSDFAFLAGRAPDLYRLLLNQNALDRPGVDQVGELYAPPASVFRGDESARPARASSPPLRLVCSCSMYAFIGMLHVTHAKMRGMDPEFQLCVRYNGLSRDTLAEAMTGSADTFDAFAIADWEARALFAHPTLASRHVVLMKLPAQLHVALAKRDAPLDRFHLAENTTAVGGFRRLQGRLAGSVGLPDANAVRLPDVLRAATSSDGVAVVWEPLAVVSESRFSLARVSQPVPHSAYLVANRKRYYDRKGDFDTMLSGLHEAWKRMLVHPEAALPYLLRDGDFLAANQELFERAGVTNEPKEAR